MHVRVLPFRNGYLLLGLIGLSCLSLKVLEVLNPQNLPRRSVATPDLPASSLCIGLKGQLWPPVALEIADFIREFCSRDPPHILQVPFIYKTLPLLLSEEGPSPEAQQAKY